MPSTYEIRAVFDQQTIVIYQAYAHNIAKPALEQQKFVSPFSFHRMTWIKPSFLWLMYRSHWGQKKSQEQVLAVRIKRSGWDKALSRGVLTHPEASVYANPADWEAQFNKAPVHIQWDTERTIRGAALNYYSIQVGISRQLIREYVDDWIVEIKDMTPTVTKIRKLLKAGKSKAARELLPKERVYQVKPETARNIMIGS